MFIGIPLKEILIIRSKVITEKLWYISFSRHRWKILFEYSIVNIEKFGAASNNFEGFLNNCTPGYSANNIPADFYLFKLAMETSEQSVEFTQS